MATKPGFHFQFVLKPELQKYMDQKERIKYGAQVSSKKKEKKCPKHPASTLWHLGPKLLIVNPQQFIRHEGDVVPPISLAEVTADAKSNAPRTAPEAQPYAQEHKNFSSDALALLLTEDVPEDDRCGASISSLRIPTTYVPTNDNSSNMSGRQNGPPKSSLPSIF